MKQAFTLIELLVVVLIIGILSAIALPQYQKAVEKSRMTEALVNLKYLQEKIDTYILENGSETHIFPKWDMELTGGEWDINQQYYTTKNFEYTLTSADPYEIAAWRVDNNNYYELNMQRQSSGEWKKYCCTGFTTMGENLCKQLESQGWIYFVGEI